MPPTTPEILYVGIFRRKDASTTGPSMELCKLFLMNSLALMARGTFQEFATFTAGVLAERTAPGVEHGITEKGYRLNSHGTPAGIAGVLISTDQYPHYYAKEAIRKIVEDFLATHSPDSYKNLVKNPRAWSDPLPWTKLQVWVDKYKDKKEDPISLAQRELDEATQSLAKTIDSVLERGEKLDALVHKSDSLSASSKMFYQQTKKQNSCCIVM